MEQNDIRFTTAREDEASQLFAKNYQLAVHIASRFRPVVVKLGIMEFDDLLQEAFIGLWHSCQRFEPQRGNKFSTYGYRCIRGFVLCAINQARFGTRNVANTASKLDITRLRQVMAEPGEEDPMHHLAIDDRDVLEGVATKEATEIVKSCIAELPEREQHVLRERAMEGKRLRHVAEDLGVCNERVRQIQLSATERLAEELVLRGVACA